MTDIDQITVRDETTFHDAKPVPPPPVDHELAPTSTHQVDRAVASLGLATHATPRTIAGHLRDVAKLLDSDGILAVKAAEFLAARGWPKGTMGDGTGSRSTSTSTSVETAARADQEEQDPGHWDDIDRTLARLLRMLDLTSLHTQSVLTDLLAHADDVDELPAGHGECACCGRFCQPQKDSNDRLRSGLCDACRKAWDRARRPERTDWIHARRHKLFDGAKGRCERCEKPWTAEPVAVGA